MTYYDLWSTYGLNISHVVQLSKMISISFGRVMFIPWLRPVFCKIPELLGSLFIFPNFDLWSINYCKFNQKKILFRKREEITTVLLVFDQKKLQQQLLLVPRDPQLRSRRATRAAHGLRQLLAPAMRPGRRGFRLSEKPRDFGRKLLGKQMFLQTLHMFDISCKEKLKELCVLCWWICVL